MQEKEQNISPIKQRILYFAATLGISKRDFYSKINVSRGTLESKTGITEDVITKFFATYPEVNIEWLMTGKGNMLGTNFATMQEKEQKKDAPIINITDVPTEGAMYSDAVTLRLMEKIDEKDAKIDQLQSELRQQSAELATFKARYPEASAAHPEGLGSAKSASTKKHSSPNADNATSANVPSK